MSSTRDPRRRMRAPGVLLLALLVSQTAWGHEPHDTAAASEAAETMVVVAVQPASPADAAGLIAEDQITSWDGVALRTQDDLAAFLAQRRPGDQVTLEVVRGDDVEVRTLTLGDRGDGSPSLGLSLAVEAGAGGQAAADDLSSEECRTWLARTYQIEELAATLNLELDLDPNELAACVDGDLAVMPERIPRGWCDNVFKVHCSGLDVLAQIGDALVGRCARALETTFEVDVRQDRAWSLCAEPALFEAYSQRGEVSDSAACRRILVEDCGWRPAGAVDP